MSGRLSHEQALELLPWLVNGTLEDAERERVERHVRDCLRCRGELRAQRAMQRLVQAQPTVQCSADQGFERLRRRMDGGRRARRTAAAMAAAIADGCRRRPAPRRLAAAAVVAVVAVGFASLWLTSTGTGGRQADFTALTAAPESAGDRLDIIFAPGVSETGMRALLTEIDATIVAGPSRLGRYTVRLAAEDLSGNERRVLLERLLADDRVRFAGWAFIAEESGGRP